MGYLKENHGLTMIGKTPPGTCPECADAHTPDQPHNKQSLTYQYRFYNQHGRWPTWEDAMAHCSDAIKELWRDELHARGIDDTGPIDRMTGSEESEIVNGGGDENGL